MMSDASPIFHTGFHKTGTTFLQRQVWPHCSDFCFYEGGPIKEKILGPYELSYDATTTRDDVISSYGLNFICSSEEYSTNPRLGGCNGSTLKSSYERIQKTFPEARIVLFLREQTSMIKSLYVQYVKMGGTLSPSKFLNIDNRNRMLNPGFCLDYYKYDQLMSFLHGLFGPGQVFVYDHMEMRADTETFISRLCNDLQITLDVEPKSLKDENVGMKSVTLSVSRMLNHLTRDLVGFEKHYLVHIPGFYRVIRFGGRMMDQYLAYNSVISANELFGSEVVEELKVYYRDSNQQLANRFGIAF